MYSLELTCKLCGHILYFSGNELWRMVLKANELELLILSAATYCNLCQEIGPMALQLKKDDDPVVFFEKIISSTTTGKYFTNEGYTTIKPTMDNPCILCCATGRLEVQYKAHKKEGSFKGVLTEECPVCDGKGYFK